MSSLIQSSLISPTAVCGLVHPLGPRPYPLLQAVEPLDFVLCISNHASVPRSRLSFSVPPAQHLCPHRLDAQVDDDLYTNLSKDGDEPYTNWLAEVDWHQPALHSMPT
jgi:hypothetical protein